MVYRCLSLLAVMGLGACQGREPIVVDGSWREKPWNELAQRGVFEDGGREARPYSEIRILRERSQLFVALYAADEDIRATDAFELRAGSLTLQLPAAGALPPRAAVSIDGTLDRPDDDDEEWIVELALPVVDAIEVTRCDRPKAGGEHCGRWAGAIK